jgi:hypothetical protein
MVVMEGRREGKEVCEDKEREEVLLSLLLLLLEIAGIIIAIIAVCTKRTFFPPLFCVGDGMGLSLSLSQPINHIASLFVNALFFFLFFFF